MSPDIFLFKMDKQSSNMFSQNKNKKKTTKKLCAV